jgi:Ala-tRNA(Pro) deacylase
MFHAESPRAKTTSAQASKIRYLMQIARLPRFYQRFGWFITDRRASTCDDWSGGTAVADLVFLRIAQWLDGNHVKYHVLRHTAVYTSAEAAAVRGTPLASGAKALVCKADDQFLMFVLPADRKLGSKAVRRARGWKSFRFASAEEVLALTGLTAGSIPPFGSLFGLATHCDRRLGDHTSINFNAGDHSISICMLYDDYLAVECPEIGEFAE